MSIEERERWQFFKVMLKPRKNTWTGKSIGYFTANTEVAMLNSTLRNAGTTSGIAR